MDMMTLALAKKYTDEKVGGSGALHFDLREMGLVRVYLNGEANTVQCDTSELRKAMLAGPVWVALIVNMDFDVDAKVLLTTAHVEAMATTQGTGIFVADKPYLCMMVVTDGGVSVSMISLA